MPSRAETWAGPHGGGGTLSKTVLGKSLHLCQVHGGTWEKFKRDEQGQCLQLAPWALQQVGACWKQHEEEQAAPTAKHTWARADACSARAERRPGPGDPGPRTPAPKQIKSALVTSTSRRCAWGQPKARLPGDTKGQDGGVGRPQPEQ